MTDVPREEELNDRHQADVEGEVYPVHETGSASRLLLKTDCLVAAVDLCCEAIAAARDTDEKTISGWVALCKDTHTKTDMKGCSRSMRLVNTYQKRPQSSDMSAVGPFSLSVLMQGLVKMSCET